MSLDSCSPRSAVWTWWVVANAAGFASAVKLALLVDRAPPFRSPFTSTLFQIAAYAGFPALVQGVILRRLGFPRGRWMLACAAGLFLGGLAGLLGVAAVDALGLIDRHSLAAALPCGVILGAVLGGCEWIVLRWDLKVAHPGWWVLACALAMAAALTVFSAVLDTRWIHLGGDGFWARRVKGAVAAAGIAGATFGAVTGIALVRLVRLVRQPIRSRVSLPLR
jgi:hypothetical protein